MSEVEGRVTGALVGLALGDALGAPVEDMSAEAIADRHPRGVPFSGHVTDDTEMALLVARSLVVHGDLNMDDVSLRLITWHAGGGVAGPSTSRGIEALVAGEPWASAGSSETASSGCLPRCVPVALALAEGRVPDATRDCCMPTHRHEHALAATVELNTALARLVAGGPWEESAPVAGAGDAGEVLAQAVAAVDAAGSAREAIEAAVAAGGDTDTAGAVAGALAGARWGLDALPREWIEACEAGAATTEAGRGLAALRRDA